MGRWLQAKYKGPGLPLNCLGLSPTTNAKQPHSVAQAASPPTQETRPVEPRTNTDHIPAGAGIQYTLSSGLCLGRQQPEQTTSQGCESPIHGLAAQKLPRKDGTPTGQIWPPNFTLSAFHQRADHLISIPQATRLFLKMVTPLLMFT